MVPAAKVLSRVPITCCNTCSARSRALVAGAACANCRSPIAFIVACMAADALLSGWRISCDSSCSISLCSASMAVRQSSKVRSLSSSAFSAVRSCSVADSAASCSRRLWASALAVYSGVQSCISIKTPSAARALPWPGHTYGDRLIRRHQVVPWASVLWVSSCWRWPKAAACKASRWVAKKSAGSASVSNWPAMPVVGMPNHSHQCGVAKRSRWSCPQ